MVESFIFIKKLKNCCQLKDLTGVIMKNVILFLAIMSIFCFVPSKTIAQINETGIFLFDSSIAGYNLDKYSGERVFTFDVRFKKPMKEKPEMFIAVTYLDASNEANLRYTIEAVLITKEGFLIRVKTWSDTKIFSIGGNWLRIGQ